MLDKKSVRTIHKIFVVTTSSVTSSLWSEDTTHIATLEVTIGQNPIINSAPIFHSLLVN